GQGYFDVGRDPTPLVIEPNETATFLVEGIDVEVGGETCKASASLIVTPPGESTQLTLEYGLRACNHGELDTSPMMPPGTKVALAPAGADRCHTDELEIDFISEGAGGGHWAEQFGLTNNGEKACTFDGYPSMVMVDKNGQQIPTTVTPAHAPGDTYNGIG